MGSALFQFTRPDRETGRGESGSSAVCAVSHVPAEIQGGGTGGPFHSGEGTGSVRRVAAARNPVHLQPGEFSLSGTRLPDESI